MKKILALVLAVAMMVSVMAVYAETVGALQVNGNLSIAGLDVGDNVKLYQVLKWSSDPEDIDVQGGWTWGENIDTTKVAAADLTTLTGGDDGDNTISGALASKIASALKGNAVLSGETTSTTWTGTVTDAGLYVAIVTAKEPNTMYNPIFVAANWYHPAEGADENNSIAVSENEAQYNDSAMAKKSTITLDKTTTGTDGNNTADDAYKTDVGEIVNFTVTTQVPAFGDNYTDPVYKIVDTMDGLVLETLPVVTVGGTTLTAGTEYTLDGAKGDSTYTITFVEDYLKNKMTNTIASTGSEVVVTYSAKITDAAEQIINQDNNSVDLIFSNGPDDTTGKGRLRDETNHFTFSIDAALIGHDEIEESSTEAIKVGVDKEGNLIVSEQSYFHKQKTHAALEGALFGLYTDAACTELYTNDIYLNGCKVTTDGTGRLKIQGLDVGTYYLREIKAPDGYIKSTETVTVVISANIVENVTITEEVDVSGDKVTVTYKTNELTDYSVTVGGSTTTYEIENSSAEVKKTDRKIDSSDRELLNTKGVELPSTGGVGTTIFYMVGGLMVLAAGIVLVSRRKAAEE